ncbi:hypothetical protein ABOZ73_00665 [Caulobacter sp. 73W]|uniref:Sporulation protein n=1 Tax=Caulobacter sp. 73W TaxID=3161137 RepID=A0AB39KT44_9CAUL
MTSYNPGPNLGGPDLSGRDTVRDIPSERPVDARPLGVSDNGVYTPVYARKPKSSATNKMMLFAIPVALVATGALVWATSGPKTTEDAATTEIADAQPVNTPAPAPDPARTPTEAAEAEPVAAPAAAPAAAARSTPAPRRVAASAPSRAAASAATERVQAASRVTPAPSASTATSDVSASVPPPVVAIPQATTTPAPAPTPQPNALTVDPMNAQPPANATPPIVDPDPR